MSYYDFSNKAPRQAHAIITELERAESRAEGKRMAAMAVLCFWWAKRESDPSNIRYAESTLTAYLNYQRLKERHARLRQSALMARSRWGWELYQRNVRESCQPLPPRPSRVNLNVFVHVGQTTYQVPNV